MKMGRNNTVYYKIQREPFLKIVQMEQLQRHVKNLFTFQLNQDFKGTNYAKLPFGTH